MDRHLTIHNIGNLAAGAALVLSFWAVLYPQYTLASDAYMKIDGSAVITDCDSTSDFYEILDAEQGEIEISFGFLDSLLKTEDNVGGEKPGKSYKAENMPSDTAEMRNACQKIWK